jgi:hypothetical protein
VNPFDITNAIKDFFASLIFYFIAMFLRILKILEQIFFYLAGAESLPRGQNENLLDSLLKSDQVVNLFFIFFGLSTILMTISVLIGVGSSIYTGKDQAGTKVVKNIFNTIMLLVMLPTAFFLFMKVFNSITPLVIKSFNNAINETKISLAESLFNSIFSNDNVSETLSFTSKYENLKAAGYYVDFYDNPVEIGIGIFGAIMMLINIGIACIDLAKRLYSLVILYVIGSFMISTYSLDEGKRYDMWKDQVIANFFQAIGCIMGVYLFFLMMSILNNILTIDTFDLEYKVLYSIIKLVFIVAGSSNIKQVSTYISKFASKGNAGAEHERGSAMQGLRTVAAPFSYLNKKSKESTKEEEAYEDKEKQQARDRNDHNRNSYLETIANNLQSNTLPKGDNNINNANEQNTTSNPMGSNSSSNSDPVSTPEQNTTSNPIENNSSFGNGLATSPIQQPSDSKETDSKQQADEEVLYPLMETQSEYNFLVSQKNQGIKDQKFENDINKLNKMMKNASKKGKDKGK